MVFEVIVEAPGRGHQYVGRWIRAEASDVRLDVSTAHHAEEAYIVESLVSGRSNLGGDRGRERGGGGVNRGAVGGCRASGMLFDHGVKDEEKRSSIPPFPEFALASVLFYVVTCQTPWAREAR